MNAGLKKKLVFEDKRKSLPKIIMRQTLFKEKHLSQRSL